MKTNTSTTLGIINSPRCRARLQTYIGKRCLQKYSNDPLAALPPVEIIDERAAQIQGLGCTTGCYEYTTGKVTLVVNDRPVKVELKWLDMIDVHEHGHHLFNDWHGENCPVDRMLFNVFRDGSNEQRFILEFPWARRILRSGRRLVLDEYLAEGKSQSSTEPLITAAFLSLAAHTVLACEKRVSGRLTALEKLYRGKASPSEVWAAVERHLGAPHASIENEWREAFEIACEAWIARATEPMRDCVKRFRKLFPEPTPQFSLRDIANMILVISAHTGDDGEEVIESPQQKTHQPLAGATKPGGTLKPDAPKNSPSSPSSSPEKENDDGDSSGGGGDEPTEPDADASASAPIEIELGGADDDADDSTDAEARRDSSLKEDDRAPLEAEIESLNRPADSLSPEIPARDGDGDSEVVMPSDARDLIRRAEPLAGSLAAQLRLAHEPEQYEQGVRGRVDARTIALDANAENPFRARTLTEESAGERSYIALVVDTSGSMNNSGKIQAARLAAQVVAGACHLSDTAYTVVTSRTLRLLAGAGRDAQKRWQRVDQTRGSGLINSLPQAIGGGDHYDESLPRLLEAVKTRDEEVRVILAITDGGFCQATAVATAINKARAEGIIVIGVGLDLSEGDAAALTHAFGEGHTVLASESNFVPKLAQTLTASVRRGKSVARSSNSRKK